MTTDQKKEKEVGKYVLDNFEDAEKQLPHHSYVRRCFVELFTYQDVQSFCTDYFNDLALGLGPITQRDPIIDELIKYCVKHTRFDDLWRYVKEVRPTNYKKYYDLWINAFNEENRQNPTNVIKDMYKDPPQHTSHSLHSLDSGNESEINKWFLGLTQKEKSLALTVALFQGMQHCYLEAIDQEIEQSLFASSQSDSQSAGRRMSNSINNNDPIMLWQKINIVSLKYERNDIEVGLTKIASLGFLDASQRQKVLKVFTRSVPYQKLSTLLDFLYQLGCNSEEEKRIFATLAISQLALAISQLALTLSFPDLMSSVIRRWAEHDRIEVQQVAANVLALILHQEADHSSDTNPNTQIATKQRLFQSEILTLLKNWRALPTSALTHTAHYTYSKIAQDFPEETLNAAKEIAKKPFEAEVAISKDSIQVTLGRVHVENTEIVLKIYALSPWLVVDALYEWQRDREEKQLCMFARIWFLKIVQLEDIATDDKLRKKVVEFVFDLWENAEIQEQHPEFRQLTTVNMKDWATIAATVNNNFYRQFFKDLRQRYLGQRYNFFYNLCLRILGQPRNTFEKFQREMGERTKKGEK